MKKIAMSICMMFVFVCMLPLCATGCKSDKLQGLAWDGYQIEGLNEYVGLGSVAFAQMGAGGMVVANSAKHDTKLAGVTEEGEIEKISFKDKHGAEKQQDARLVHLDVYDNISILGYTTDPDFEYINANEFRYVFEKNCMAYSEKYKHMGITYKQVSCFIMDNKTGKMFSFEQISRQINELMDNNLNTYAIRKTTKPCWFVARTNDMYSKEYVFEFDFESGEVEIKLNPNELESLGSLGGMDIYGNVYNSDCSKYINTSGEIKYLSSGYMKSYNLGQNQILYKVDNDKTYYLNENEEFVEIELEDNDFVATRIYSGEYHLGKKGNVSYFTTKTYWMDPDTEESLLRTTLAKIVYDEQQPWLYTIAEKNIILETGVGDGIEKYYKVVKCNNKVFVADDEDIVVYNIDTKEIKVADSDLRFKDLIYNKTFNQVRFKAVDKNLMVEVDGYFTADDEVVIGDFAGVTSGLNRVFVVWPLN